MVFGCFLGLEGTAISPGQGFLGRRIGLYFLDEVGLAEGLDWEGFGHVNFLDVVEELFHVGLEGIGIVGEMGETLLAGFENFLHEALVFVEMR